MSEENRLQRARKCVNFLYGHDGIKYKAIGTGFFFALPLEKGKQESYIELFMVTAKHVLYPNGVSHLPAIAVRLNRKDGLPPQYEHVILGSQGFEVFIHQNPSVDIAMFHFYTDPTFYDFGYVPINIIPNEETIKNRHIAEGTPICISGLFSPYVGNESDEPFLRFGKVSLMPKGKIPIQEPGKPKMMIDAYLCETLSFSGTSGSPVFFALDNLDPNLKPRYDKPDMYLAGIVKGHYPDLRQMAFERRSDDIYYQLNAGIAVVTPSYQLREIAESEPVRMLIKDTLSKLGSPSDQR